MTKISIDYTGDGDRRRFRPTIEDDRRQLLTDDDDRVESTTTTIEDDRRQQSTTTINDRRPQRPCVHDDVSRVYVWRIQSYVVPYNDDEDQFPWLSFLMMMMTMTTTTTTTTTMMHRRRRRHHDELMTTTTMHDYTYYVDDWWSFRWIYESIREIKHPYRQVRIRLINCAQVIESSQWSRSTNNTEEGCNYVLPLV